ncbi:MAG: SLBB domain-containing protein, partial [Proteobacteria bacterium]|nr:SLBB domain-containing protein [Pseudomonadota bacterium]
MSQQDALTDQLSGQISTKSGPPTQKPKSPITSIPQQDSTQASPPESKAKLPLPPEEPTEFQRQIEQSIGSKLPIFGQSLFDGVPDTFAPLDRVPVTADYVIGPGDELLVRVWGQVDMDLKLVVDRNCSVYLPEVGNVSVTGVSYKDLSQHLASLGQLRSIQIFVVGWARRPGSYTVSSLSTLVNAIFASGGPSLRGSMRQIQVKRGNKTVTTFDLYDLIVKGDKSKDIQLLPGDVIYIPSVGQQVAIVGSVNVPSIYEIKNGSTLNELLEWAGGLSTGAGGHKVTVERIVDRAKRKVEELVLNDSQQAILRDGDFINIYPLSPRIDNAVTLRGNVAQPMRFPWREGMRISDLIPSKDVLFTRDFWLGRNRLGIPVPLAQQNAQPQQNAQLPRVGTEVNWDYAVVERINGDLSTLLLPFNLGKLVLDRDPQQDLPLQPGDTVTIFSKEDLRVPEERQTKLVRLEGEFNAAGIYRVEPGETLRQLVGRVGLTANAYPYATQFTRESLRRYQQQKLDELSARTEAELERAARDRSKRAVTAEDSAQVKEDLASQRAVLAKLKDVKANGRIVLDIEAEDKSGTSFPDIALEAEDRVFVPSKSGAVSVWGSVYNESTFIYRAGRSLSEYLNLAGGPIPSADESNIYLIRANGMVARERQSGWLSGSSSTPLMPGDTIVVPEDFSGKFV